MDQDAFRALLSAPRTASSASSAASTTGWGVKPRKTASTSTSAAFKPRASGAKKGSKGAPAETKEEGAAAEGKKAKAAKEDKYVDRAAARRAGKSNEFSGVEELLESFEARTAGVADHSLDEQRKYLVSLAY